MKTKTNGFTARASAAAFGRRTHRDGSGGLRGPCRCAKRRGTVQADQHGRGRGRRRQRGVVQGRRIQRAAGEGCLLSRQLRLARRCLHQKRRPVRRRLPDNTGMFRWRIKGIDLGLETRSLSAEVGVAGKFQINFGYDELRRNRSDSYQTPYNGAGTNTLTLPATWLVPTVAASGGANTISARGLVTAIGDAPYISTASGQQRCAGQSDRGSDGYGRRRSKRRPSAFPQFQSLYETHQIRPPASATASPSNGVSTRTSGPSTRTA